MIGEDSPTEGSKGRLFSPQLLIFYCHHILSLLLFQNIRESLKRIFPENFAGVPHRRIFGRNTPAASDGVTDVALRRDVDSRINYSSPNVN